MPEGFWPEDVDVSEAAIAYPMGTKSEYIMVLGSNKGLVRIEVGFDREAFCDSFTDDGPLDVTVVGSLTTGQYFSGSDTIKLIGRKHND